MHFEYGWIRPNGTLLPGEGRHVWDGTHAGLAVEEVQHVYDKILSSAKAMELLLREGYARVWVERYHSGNVTYAVVREDASRDTMAGIEMFALRSRSAELLWFWHDRGASGRGTPSKTQRLDLAGLRGLAFGRRYSPSPRAAFFSESRAASSR